MRFLRRRSQIRVVSREAAEIMLELARIRDAIEHTPRTTAAAISVIPTARGFGRKLDEDGESA